MPDQRAGLPAVRAGSEFAAVKDGVERVLVPHEARWAERRCQGPVAVSAPTPPVKVRELPARGGPNCRCARGVET